MATILVVTPVHHPDDTRIRHKLIRSLATEHEVRFAATEPGPTDPTGLTWVPLRGGRIRRNLGAWRRILFSRYDTLSLHDPEMLLAGIVARAVRRKKVIFDVHERLPEQARRRLPGPLGSIGAWIVLRLLRLAERLHDITLAEAGYANLLRRPHPVLANLLDPTTLPDPVRSGDGRAVYVGDVTEARGVTDLAEACAQIRIDLLVIGRVEATLAERLRSIGEQAGTKVEVTGRLPHPEAMERMGRASIGVSPLRDIPNYRNSLPTKVLEYAALGLPVVATDLPGTREILAGFDGVRLVPAGDVAALGEAITSAIQSGERPLAQAGTVRERYRWSTEDVLDVYGDRRST